MLPFNLSDEQRSSYVPNYEVIPPFVEDGADG
jgi:hypothetical protein